MCRKNQKMHKLILNKIKNNKELKNKVLCAKNADK